MQKKAPKRRAEYPAEKQDDSRRQFLKKAAYATPKLMALGYLTRPESGHADKSGPVGPPPGWTP